MSATPTNFRHRKIQLIEEARTVLRGAEHASTVYENLYRKLEEFDQYGYASEVLLKKIEEDKSAGRPEQLEDIQKLSKYIYKDTSLPSTFKFDEAFHLLNSEDPVESTQRCETLGLAGSIFKRKWLYDHQDINLELSLRFYTLGMESWLEWRKMDEKGQKENGFRNDNGWNAINAAYMNELMSVNLLERMQTLVTGNPEFRLRLEEARRIREDLLSYFIDSHRGKLTDHSAPDWIIATVAEAYFGIWDFEKAGEFIRMYFRRKKEKLTPDENILPWKIRTFHQQMLGIAYHHACLLATMKRQDIPDAFKRELSQFCWPDKEKEMLETIGLFLSPENDEALQEDRLIPGQNEKSGLCFSGGGFRASLFHIGVLAALAERDRLKDISVISCVSGGSIIGAYYYLQLKKLLESKPDRDTATEKGISREDYIQLVEETITGFLNGVQKNLRMRIFSNPLVNLKIFFSDNYTRTNRLGELYEKHLYRPLLPGSEGEIWMDDLFIRPKDAAENFSMETDNWKRRNRIPQLILNATTLNTGHNWQFTASWMGEPPGEIRADFDAKPRLRRMYYGDAPDGYKRFRLGYAVGASSCVPALFDPISLKGLYPGVDLQLVDGGLNDNQGLSSVLEQECKEIFISDASGQISMNEGNEGNELSVFLRCDSILQERLRETQLSDVLERSRSSQVRRLYQMHLKKGLKAFPMDWTDCADPPRRVVYKSDLEFTNKLTAYNVLKNIQQELSELRTDLDSFNDREAYALMYSGYRQTLHEIEMQDGEQPESGHAWEFLKIEEEATQPGKSKALEKTLKNGKNVALKVFSVNPLMKAFGFFLAGIVLLAILLVIWKYWNEDLFAITGKSIFTAGVVYLLGKMSAALGIMVSLRSRVRKYAMGILASLVGAAAFAFYVHILNPVYNRSGRIRQKATGRS